MFIRRHVITYWMFIRRHVITYWMFIRRHVITYWMFIRRHGITYWMFIRRHVITYWMFIRRHVITYWMFIRRHVITYWMFIRRHVITYWMEAQKSGLIVWNVGIVVYYVICTNKSHELALQQFTMMYIHHICSIKFWTNSLTPWLVIMKTYILRPKSLQNYKGTEYDKRTFFNENILSFRKWDIW